MRPAKTQISLGIHPVWSESSLCAQWVAQDPRFLQADSDDTLIRMDLSESSLGAQVILLVLSWGGSCYLFPHFRYDYPTTGMIVGGGVGIVVILGTFLLCCLYYCCKRQLRRRTGSSHRRPQGRNTVIPSKCRFKLTRDSENISGHFYLHSQLLMYLDFNSFSERVVLILFLMQM